MDFAQLCSSVPLAAWGSWAGPAELCAVPAWALSLARGSAPPGSWAAFVGKATSGVTCWGQNQRGCRAVGLSPPQEQSRRVQHIFKKPAVKDILSVGLFSCLKSFNFCWPRAAAALPGRVPRSCTSLAPAPELLLCESIKCCHVQGTDNLV